MKQSSASPKRWYTAGPLAAALVVSGLAVVPGPTAVGATPLRMEAHADAGAVTNLAEGDAGAPAEVVDAYGKLPLSFEVNQGQVDPEVKFVSRGAGRTVFLTATEAVFSLSGPGSDSRHDSPDRRRRLELLAASFGPEMLDKVEQPEGAGGDVVRVRLDGANHSPQVVGAQRLPGVANYLTGDDPSGWHTGIPTYGQVEYRGVYPGIDQVWHGHEGQLEHDFVVASGADPSVITIVYDGADNLRLDEDGSLVMDTIGGALTEQAPRLYQEVGGGQRPVAGSYRILGDNRVGFEVDAFDRSRPLVIDPVLVYSTYLGGTGNGSGADTGNGIAVDSGGNAYVTGQTDSANFPTQAPLQATNASQPGSTDAFVTKLNPAGTGLVYSTYLGGSGDDRGADIAIDSDGSAYVTGLTTSGDFPVTADALQASLSGDQDGFVAKIDPSGSGLVYGTFLGGSAGDAVAVDSSGNAYVAGEAFEDDFPATPGALYESFSPQFFGDTFVAKVDPAGSALVYGTYLGGAFQADGMGIDVDSDGHAYVAAATPSASVPGASTCAPALTDELGAFVAELNDAGTGLVYSCLLGGGWATDVAVDATGAAYVTGLAGTDLPVVNAFQPAPGGDFDAFVAKVNPGGVSLAYSSYLGGSGADKGYVIAVDPGGAAYLSGITDSTDLPAAQNGFGGAFDVFATKVDPLGGLTYSRYIGGSGVDGQVCIICLTGGGPSGGVAVDSAGNAYITGETGSGDLATTPGAFQTTNAGGHDAFVTKLSPTGTDLVYSTYLGGSSGVDSGSAIAVDSDGSAYVAGTTESTDFPTEGADQPAKAGKADAFVTKLNPAGTALVYSTYLGGSDGDFGGGIAVDGLGAAYLTGTTASNDFPTVNAMGPSLNGLTDAFAAKLSPDGDTLAYSTYLGGSGNENLNELFGGNDIEVFLVLRGGIAVDLAGAAYVTGTTLSSDFPTTAGAFQETDPDPADADDPGLDTFVTKLSPDGDVLVYSTYLGGSTSSVFGGFGPSAELAAGVAVDTAGNAYVTGTTFSDDFPTAAPFQASFGGGLGDAFVTKLSPSGSTLVYSTYLGGGGEDFAAGVAVDLAGSAYVTGTTVSDDFPTNNTPIQPANAGFFDAFVTKLNPAGNTLAYSTYLGGSGGEIVCLICAGAVGVPLGGIAVDSTGAAYVTGLTGSTDFPTRSPIQASLGGGVDPFVAKLNPAGSALVYSTYLGGGDFDHGRGIAVDGAGAAYVTGTTGSGDFPTTPDAFQAANRGGDDVFVTKIAFGADLQVAKIADEPIAVGETLTYTLTVTNHGPSEATDVVLTDPLPDGVTFLSATPSQGSCQGTTCLLGTIADDASAIVSIAVRTDVAGTITNTATVAASEPDPVPENNTATETTIVQATPPVGTGMLTVSVVGGDPDFTLDGPFDAEFTLDPGESTTFEDIPAGVYTLAMTGLEDGLVVDAISCGAATLSVDLAARRVGFEIGDDDVVTCRFTVSQVDDGDGGYGDDPGGPGFGFDSPFDDAGQSEQPGPSPTGDPTLAGVLAATDTEASGGGPQGGAVPGDAAGQPAVSPVAGGELPRTGNEPLPMGVAAGMVFAGQALRAIGRRRRARTA